jgi:long-chain acyl-CoA synthetase
MLFTDSWDRVRRKYESTPAIYYDSCAVARTFAEIEEERVALRRELSDLPTGSAVVASLGNEPTWPALFLACLDHKLVLVPLDADIPQSQLQTVCELAGAGCVVSASGIQRLDLSPVEWPAPRPDLLKITSGTTGAPRAVRFRQEHLVADCKNICQTMGIHPEDLNLGVIPFSHSYGFSNLITPLLWQASRLVCSVDRMPRAVQEHLRATGATVFAGTPALFQALAGLPDPLFLPRLRLCISAGAPLAQETARQFRERFGVPIHTFYGSSECGGICYDRDGRAEEPTGFVGQPMDGVQVKPRQDDRIVVSGPTVADGYFPNPDPELLDGAVFIPGDLVRWSDAGLHLFGRASDYINIAGRKLHPSVIEEHLRKLPGVVDAIVFGIPSNTRNEVAIAYVLSPQGIARQALELHCRSGLSQWQVPRDFVILQEFPVNARGKLNRAELAQAYREARGK